MIGSCSDTGHWMRSDINPIEALQALGSKGRIISLHFKDLDIEEPELVELLSRHFGVPSVDLNGVEIDESILKIIPGDIARKYTIYISE